MSTDVVITHSESAPSRVASSPDAAGPRRPPTAATRWRPLLIRWHFYAGILIGPFLLLAAITGTLYALIPQLDRAIYHHELTVARVGSAPLPLDAQVSAARRAHPEGSIVSVTPAPRPGDTTRVVLAVDDVPADRHRTVFIDPYTGVVRGALTTYGEWLPVRAWFAGLHRDLHLGVIGRNYSEIAASWLWVVAFGGLILWIGHRRRNRALARLLLPDRGTASSSRRRTMSWHGAVGVWIIIGLIVLSASGLSWSRWAGANIAELRTAMAWTKPTVSTEVDHSRGATPSGAPDIADFTRVYATARHAGLVGPMNISVPVAAPTGIESTWTVSERARGYPSHYDSIAIDPQTLRVTDRVNFADWPLAAKLTAWAISAHMGLFGVANQIILVLLGIGLITVIVRGYLMWWRRRPATSPLPTSPPRGTLGSLLPYEAAALIAACAGLGWFLPWFGIPLVLFVITDTITGMRVSR
ncbi:MAG: PepSY-associated TM helix domain-containing protein [Gordonia sp. (in: high G+C Gram-positive bacteria)]